MLFRKRKGLVVIYKARGGDYFFSRTSEDENYAELFDVIIDQITEKNGNDFLITNVIKL